jgi:NDP-sugar pyrophosphorylase family protein
MNQISKTPLRKLGYDFIPQRFLPKEKDEYYLRMEQNQSGIAYRPLKLDEVALLNKNGNSSDNWSKVMVSDIFLPELVHNCSFFGLVRIGRLEPYFLEFHNLRRPVGLYNSTIISSDIGNNVVIDNVNYLSHYIIGNDVMLVNINELATTDHAKFGNGILKEGEPESIRIQLEICNENGGRSIIPFDGMLPGDAWLWSRFREDEPLQTRFREFTENEFDKRRGYYGMIGDRTVIKNCRIVKDVKTGTDAYLKGANKLKNLTINSSPEAKSQIGEGCELVNGIIGNGCRIFYGVKAVRFILASHSQLKYGARLINSYLGNNATISCCEVLNSLIFPAHEQHHNNSFLCASLLMGQSNMAAGATIGSNHNSRSADGELIAGRGFWPGLCVSVKHNSRFASFIIVAKGDYPAELDIPLPFSLLSNDVSDDELLVMPAYWFLHNMYALARNAWKYVDRDKRIEKIQILEYDYLAPDSIHEVADAMKILERLTARAWLLQSGESASSEGNPLSDSELILLGKDLLEKNDPSLAMLEITADNFENSSRKVRINKVPLAYPIYAEIILHYAICRVVEYIGDQQFGNLADLQMELPAPSEPESWVNAGGQLLKRSSLNSLISDIHSKRIGSWQDVHRFYLAEGANYNRDKLHHALDILFSVQGISIKCADPVHFRQLLEKSISTAAWITNGILVSREKDYDNPFRRMVYDSQAEMDKVLGRPDENSFIKSQFEGFQAYRGNVNFLINTWKL